MTRPFVFKTGALIAAALIAGNGVAADDKDTTGGLFGFKGAQATVSERADSRNQKVSQDSNTLQETKKKKKKKKRKKKARRGSYN